MTAALERAIELETQLSDLLALVSRDDFANHYSEARETREVLKKHLSTIRTDISQLSDSKNAAFFAGDPRMENANRDLIRDVETIGVELEFDINPRLESAAKLLAEQAKAANSGDKGLLQRAAEELDKALALGSPLIKAAALATAIKTLLSFWQAMPK
jgi:hypothetical protein